ncbi:DUF445 domain-containing protein [Bacillus sp. 03113]|uniref:DUF445 domain-containing protein n=1 Tax=Bacillus sp. 03113 TaxID=2578211 RepID=UPI001141B305|nr:DUF445 domain-containing protein [Bacillus sp. 03113]
MEQKNKIQSKKSKHYASISLGIMGAGFLGTIPIQDTSYGYLIQGGFEAGLVGGLADWFAVTALFRHPLGLPIPHTALLPKKRKKMTESLVTTLQNDWLTKESLREKMVHINVTNKIVSMIEKELHSDSVKRLITMLIEKNVNRINFEKAIPFIGKELKSFLLSIETKAVLQKIVDQVVIREYDEKALDFLLGKVEKWAIEENRSSQLGSWAMKALNGIELDGFLQFALKSFQSLMNEEKLGSIIQNLILNGIKALSKKDNSYRQSLLFHVRTELRKMKNNQNLIEEIDQWKNKLINDWDSEDTLERMLEKLKRNLVEKVQNTSFMDEHLLPYISKFISQFKDEPEKNTLVEGWIQNGLAIIIEKNHSKIGDLVQENLNKLDDKTLIDMMENNIGKDLQWIRVNGAVCGFVIGLILTGLKMVITLF